MSDCDAQEPQGISTSADRAKPNKERLAAALRENLRRRKTQRGARRATNDESADPTAKDTGTGSAAEGNPDH